MACEEAGIIPLVPKPLTSNIKAEDRFDKRHFVYDKATDEYECSAGDRATHRFTTEEHLLNLRKYCPAARSENGVRPPATGEAHDGSTSTSMCSSECKCCWMPGQKPQ